MFFTTFLNLDIFFEQQFVNDELVSPNFQISHLSVSPSPLPGDLGERWDGAAENRPGDPPPRGPHRPSHGCSPPSPLIPQRPSGALPGPSSAQKARIISSPPVYKRSHRIGYSGGGGWIDLISKPNPLRLVWEDVQTPGWGGVYPPPDFSHTAMRGEGGERARDPRNGSLPIQA